jgi:hypothetical protein
MAAVLRHILTSDGRGLAKQVLHEYNDQIKLTRKQRMRFFICDQKPIGDYWWAGDFSGSDPVPGYTVKRLSLDDFLNYTVIKIQDRAVSIVEIINFLANKEGGVHRDTKEYDELLRQIQHEFSIGGTEGISSAMHGIANVVVESLEPLYNQVVRINKRKQQHYGNNTSARSTRKKS